MRIGLKLHSSNCEPALINSVKRKLDYIELFVVPGTIQNIVQWSEVDIPFFLHAPHSYANLNLSISSQKQINVALIAETEKYRLSLQPIRIVFHPGINGSIDETISQIKYFKNIYPELFKTALIENKPKMGLRGEICVGSSPSEIERIMRATDIGFCLDLGHAIYYSAWAKMDYNSVLGEFLKLDPFLFHLSDGMVSSITDMHLNYGHGNFDLHGIIRKLPQGTYVTIETGHKADPDIIGRDIDFLKTIIQKISH